MATIIAFLVNPFDWETETANLSHDLIQRAIIGPFFYPDDPPFKSTVVLISDGDLEALDTTWPMPLSIHADLLDIILQAEPKGVFVDFVFYDERDDDNAEALRHTIKSYHDNGVPLWFARAEGPNLERAIRKDLLDAGAGNFKPSLVSIALPDDTGVARTYAPCSRRVKAAKPEERSDCLCVNDEGRAIQCKAPRGEQKANDKTGTSLAWTAAFAMYRHAFPELAAAEAGPSAPKAKRIDGDSPLWDMDIMWSNRSNAWNDRYLYRSREDSPDDLCEPIDGTLIGWLYVALSGEHDLRQSCPYIDTLLARDVRNGFRELWIKSKLRGRYIFYGGDLAALGDRIVPPTHTRLPAIFLHAMAFDNLMTFRGNYKHQELPFLTEIMDRQWFDLLLAIAVACVVVRYARARQRNCLAGNPLKAADRLPATVAKGWLHRRSWWFILSATGLVTASIVLANQVGRGGMTDIVLSVALAVSALSLVHICRRAGNGSHDEPRRGRVSMLLYSIVLRFYGRGAARVIVPSTSTASSHRTDDTEATGWQFVRTLWRLKRGWIGFIISIGALLLTFSIVMLLWFNVSTRNWVGVVLLAVVVGESVFKFWIEQLVRFIARFTGNPALEELAFLGAAEAAGESKAAAGSMSSHAKSGA